MEQDPSPKHAVLDNIRFILKDIRREYRSLLVCLSAETLLGCITPAVTLFLPKVIIEFLTQPAETHVTIGKVALLLLLSVISSAALASTTSARYVYLGDLNMHYLKKLFYSALDRDYQRLESARGQTEYQRARRTLVGGNEASVTSLVTTGQSFITGTLCFILYSSVLAQLNPIVMAALALLSILQYAVMKRARTFEQENRGKLADKEKKMFIIESIAANPSYGKDIRMYAMSRWIQTVWNGILAQYTAISRMVGNRNFRAAAASVMLFLIRDIGAYLYLIWRVVVGDITVAAFSVYIGAVAGFSAFTGNIILQINELKRASLFMDDLRAFLDNAAKDDSVSERKESRSELDSIELRDVCFAYEDSGAPFIDHLNLTIRRGEKLAIVGLNGAGKTTLIKLLCGLYEPQNGTILINGKPATALNKQTRRSFYSVVFQDAVIFPFSIAENVSMQPESETDYIRVADCLQKAGLDQTVNHFSQGMHTVLSKVIDPDGIVLSGGQRQKLLLARAIYKDAPVWLFDESSAFLDPPSESALYRSFRNLDSQKTVVFISHRLVNARYCDRIVLLEDGAAIESGSHEALMDLGGRYARMYRAQAAWNELTTAAYA
jgi:ABC-type multidrug transport system fused ATPase/permease subunit